MKALLALVACLLVSGCIAVVPIPIAATATATRAPDTSIPVRATDSFTNRLNAFRASQGAGPVRQSAILTRAAQAHAQDMSDRGYFSHRSRGGPNGETLMARSRAAGCNVRAVAENIAKGQRGEAEVLEDWANSSGHRRNMLNRRMTDYGLGRAGDIWVLKLSSGC